MEWSLAFNRFALDVWRFFGDWPTWGYFLLGLVAVALLGVKRTLTRS